MPEMHASCSAVLCIRLVDSPCFRLARATCLDYRFCFPRQTRGAVMALVPVAASQTSTGVWHRTRAPSAASSGSRQEVC